VPQRRPQANSIAPTAMQQQRRGYGNVTIHSAIP